MKTLLKAVAGLLVALLVLILLHPLWIGPVVRTAVSQLAPKFLGVPAKLDGFSLNAYTGRVTFDGFELDNPPGCREPKFVKVGHLCVDVDPMSVLSDPIVVEEITLNDLYVSLVTDDKKTYNFTTVAAAAAPTDSKADADKPAPEPKKDEPKKPAPKVIIDLVQVQNALVQWERVPLPLPSFRMTGIGRGSDGVTFEAAWEEMEAKFLDSLGPLANGLKACLDSGTASLDAGLKAIDSASKQLNDQTKQLNDQAKQLGDQAKKLGDAVKPLATLGGATKSVDTVTTKTVDATTKTVDETTKAVSTATGKTIETATKAVEGAKDAFKSLFGK